MAPPGHSPVSPVFTDGTTLSLCLGDFSVGVITHHGQGNYEFG